MYPFHICDIVELSTRYSHSEITKRSRKPAAGSIDDDDVSHAAVLRLGIGIGLLAILLTGSRTIRDVILSPRCAPNKGAVSYHHTITCDDVMV